MILNDKVIKRKRIKIIFLLSITLENIKEMELLLQFT